jgi:hypothetical protein
MPYHRHDITNRRDDMPYYLHDIENRRNDMPYHNHDITNQHDDMPYRYHDITNRRDDITYRRHDIKKNCRVTLKTGKISLEIIENATKEEQISKEAQQSVHSPQLRPVATVLSEVT